MSHPAHFVRLTVCVFAFVAASVEAVTLHVSPAGNDAWSGRRAAADGQDGPFATPVRAQQAVRELIATGLSEPVEVVVHAGTYRLDAPLAFTPADSGTQRCPITYRAEGEVIFSGGVPIEGWRKNAGGLWSADVPQAADGQWRFRILRVGDRWARRARHPDFDPARPHEGGWLFADWHGEPWEVGRFDRAVADLHEVGTKLTWRLRVPAAGRYHVWLRYASHASARGVSDMSGRTALQAGDAEPVALENLPDTGGWSNFHWARSATIQLPQGECVLTWSNVKGGGLSLDALALTSDDAWDPGTAISTPTWWGAFEVKPPTSPHGLLLIQAEAFEKAQGGKVKPPSPPTPAGITAYLRYKPGDIPAWGQIAGAEVHIFPAWGWVNGIVPIERIDADSRRIYFTGGAAQEIRMGNRYFVENVRAALDAPGEWYLDEKAGRVEYIPFEDAPTPQNVVAPRLDRLIELRGQDDRWVEHVHFVGLSFIDTDYTVTREYYSPADAAIHMARVRDCSIRNCTFRRLGGYAVRMEAGTHRVAFTGNDLYDLGQGGLFLHGGVADQPHHIHIAGNVMRRLGLIYKHVAGVYCTTSSDNEIVHNTFSDLSRYAISLKSYTDHAFSHRNRVEFNDIRRTNLETNDTGAIETLGRHKQDTGNVIRHNLILDVIGMGTDRDGRILTPYFNWGIYLDDYSSGTLVYGNIVARTVNGGICVHGGKNNTFENNIFVDAANEQIRLQPRDDFMRGNRFVRNIVAFSASTVEGSAQDRRLVFAWSKWPGTFTEWDHNLYWCRESDLTRLDSKVTPAGSYAEWQAAGMDAHTVLADPMFLDAAPDDYRLRSDSPARSLGIKDIPVEMIGADYWRATHRE